MQITPNIMGVRWFLLGLLLAAFATSIASDVVARVPDGQASSGVAPGGNVKSWYEATDPFHIVGPIYYVGTRGLSVFLITTSAGNILLSGAMPEPRRSLKRRFASLHSSPRTFASCCSIMRTSIMLAHLPTSRS